MAIWGGMIVVSGALVLVAAMVLVARRVQRGAVQAKARVRETGSHRR